MADRERDPGAAGAGGIVRSGRLGLAGGQSDPFVSYAFLSAFEELGSVGRARLVAAPLMAKMAVSPSARARLPEVPQPGRICLRPRLGRAWSGPAAIIIQAADRGAVHAGDRAAAAGARSPRCARRCRGGGRAQNGLSSAHVTFLDRGEEAEAERAAGSSAHGMQFHWHNTGYRDFDDFLGALRSRKRKQIRRERPRRRGGSTFDAARQRDGAAIGTRSGASTRTPAAANGAAPISPGSSSTLAVERLGDACCCSWPSGRHADRRRAQPGRRARCTAATGAPKTCRSCISSPLLPGDRLRDRARPGAVEAGAQGEHKLARGYEPVPTYTAHFIAHTQGLARAVDDFLRAASAQARRAYEHGGAARRNCRSAKD